ncbi:MAG: PDZ domain-containing protein [Ruminococcaceae bacterium]|nr:PDZ domain-containing protein [Oscillospiraceae bacterium]
MEEIRKKTSIRIERREDEVVGCYVPSAREVVGVLTHEKPLPGRAAAAEKPVLRKKKKTGLWIFLLCAAVLVGVSVGAYFYPWEQTGGTQPDGEEAGSSMPGFDGGYDFTMPGGETFDGIQIMTHPAGETRLTITEAQGEALTPQETYARVNPAVVTVVADMVSGGSSVGTGVIFTRDGYMLTNYHVVQGGYACMVITADNAQYEALYVAGDQASDLAVLKIVGDDLPAADIGDSSQLEVGDAVYAIGSPLGTELRGTFTNGIVSAVDREVDVDGRSMILLQTNTALNSGNSGGPLINQYGQVVGINTIKMMSDYSTVEGLGFAIPSLRVRRLVNELLAYGEVAPEPLLGITVEVLGTKLPDGTVGARIQSVTPGSASEKAGLRGGDVIVAVGGESISGSADVLRVRGWYSLGDKMPMRVWRDGKYLDVTLELLQAAGE